MNRNRSNSKKHVSEFFDVLRWTNYVIRAIEGVLFFTGLALSHAANATITCTTTSPGISVSLPISISPPRDLNPGAPLSAWIQPPESQILSGCTATDTTTTYIQARSTLIATGKTVVDTGITYTVYETSVPGVGIIFSAKDKHSGLFAVQTSYTDLLQGWSSFWDASVAIRLIATGEPIISGTVVGGQVGLMRVIEKSSGSTTSEVPLNLVTSTVVQAKSCSVSAGSRNLSVLLGEVRTSDFGVVSTTAGNGDFNIVLENCSSGINLFATFTDGNNLANISDVLSLTPGNSVASGVGIRIRKINGPIVSFGPDSSSPGTLHQLSLGGTVAGTITLPFTATYVKTNNTVSSGVANGVVTFTLSYQ
ncbi:type 1 fimbrial protein [Pseudomonas sp. B21-040]|uniref:fimbrial protein n=1 Tax=Pseudomonas sp. B21-040 TaxID=2895486 RepID=UPI0021602633|nr:fimbrial protein [Pseudomonas sp. B21-040]UVL43183.1 type 1 fimbrial protein [Pseudomonas sp. B21-040]